MDQGIGSQRVRGVISAADECGRAAHKSGVVSHSRSPKGPKGFINEVRLGEINGAVTVCASVE